MLHNLCRGVASSWVALTLLALTGCGSLSGAGSKAAQAITPYKIDIVQGNVVTREQVAVLRPGMPRAMVQDVLGTSLLTSVFHAERWDYVFTLKRQGAEPQARRVTVFFKGDAMDRVEADELPSESEFVATLKSNPIKGPLPPLTASEENLSKFPAPAKTDAPGTAAGGAPTVYPPLEPAAGP
ncbi:outer membrane protein assembly factor BamE [Rhodoferax saidenbachensis]|uniref:Outer membrane protein assembly factor BamE n=1 Tax=Rhodoferax saidenbachensis TaxID=1484693 RepID=A0ABU1ZL78_9BURK|nr:outer membrane protein assembly factor BamE [Rhodoferax saidenbachensis]MDR7306300.1 outer membrane protein assembly factor BamE [Rhodoferax saidenbachensis]